MTTVDFTPPCRNTAGFDRLIDMFHNALNAEQDGSSFPPHDIEAIGDNHDVISLATAGFSRAELEV